MVFIILFFLFILLVLLILGHYGLPERKLPLPAEPGPSEIMADAEPFEYAAHGSEVGVLLIHGFEGSPFTMRDLGKFLHQRGYHVVAPLLPGHGTSVENFIKTRYDHWYAKVETIYQQYRTQFKYFFVIGLSMGGNLTLRLAQTFHDYHRPTGIVVLSAPVFFNGFFNGKLIMYDWRLMLSGVMKIFIPFLKKEAPVVHEEALSPWRGYLDYYTLPCLHSLKRNVAKVRAKLWKINSPALLIHALNDRTVNAENQVYIYNHIRSREKIAYSFSFEENVSARHLLTTHHKSQGRAFYYIASFIEEAIKDFEKPLPVEKPGLMDRMRMWWES